MNITTLTNQYISEHPSVKDCMRKGLINFSALARRICKERKVKNIDAVIVACRRYQARLAIDGSDEDTIRDMVRHAKLRVRSKMGVLIADRPKDLSAIHEIQRKIRNFRGDCTIIEGDEVITVITNMEHIPLVEAKLRNSVLKIRQNLVQLIMIFDRRIETTSGVMFFIFSLLAGKGINVLEEVSCWTDVVLVIEERYLARAMEVLNIS